MHVLNTEKNIISFDSIIVLLKTKGNMFISTVIIYSWMSLVRVSVVFYNDLGVHRIIWDSFCVPFQLDTNPTTVQ